LFESCHCCHDWIIIHHGFQHEIWACTCQPCR
jgi:hypothetical protein